jgi:two-component system CheB/CheR fusion protein
MKGQVLDETEVRLAVGIGASAGGLEAFKKLVPILPVGAGMTYLLVQHLDPNHKSLLRDILAPLTSLDVREASDAVVVEPDTIYEIPPGVAMAITAGQLELTEPTLHRGVRLPVDHLFRSLAREYGPRAVGIVLSGAGSDGSSGLREIKAAGGLTLAQDPKTSGQTGMPQSAIETGIVDLVVGIAEFPTALDRFASLPHKARRVSADG